MAGGGRSGVTDPTTPERAEALALARALEGLDDRNAQIDAVEAITRLGGFAPRDPSHPILPFSDFDPDQQEMLRRIAAKPVPPSGAISGWTGAGVPKDTPSLRRWVGLDPPGVLEATVEVDGRRLPRWSALQELRARGLAFGEASAMVEITSPTEACDLVLEVLTNAYGLQGRFGGSVGPADLARAIDAAGEAGARWAAGRLEAMAAADLDRVRCGVPPPKVLATLLRAALRVGYQPASCFDAHIEWTPENRELFASLPERRRHALALEGVARCSAAALEQRLASLEALADLLVTPEVVAQLLATVKRWPALKALAPRIRALGATR